MVCGRLVRRRTHYAPSTRSSWRHGSPSTMPWWWGAGPGTDTPTGSDARRRHLRERAIGCARGGGLHNSRRRIGVRQSHQFLVGRAALVLSWGRRQGPAGRPRTGRPMKRASGQPRYKARAGRHVPIESGGLGTTNVHMDRVAHEDAVGCASPDRRKCDLEDSRIRLGTAYSMRINDRCHSRNCPGNSAYASLHQPALHLAIRRVRDDSELEARILEPPQCGDSARSLNPSAP